MDSISAYLLLFLFVAFVISGFSMTGEYGINDIVDIRTASAIHLGICELIIVFFCIHVGIRIYSDLPKWEIIGGGGTEKSPGKK